MFHNLAELEVFRNETFVGLNDNYSVKSRKDEGGSLEQLGRDKSRPFKRHLHVRDLNGARARVILYTSSTQKVCKIQIFNVFQVMKTPLSGYEARAARLQVVGLQDRGVCGDGNLRHCRPCRDAPHVFSAWS